MMGGNNNIMSLLPFLLSGMGKGGNQQGMNIADILSKMQGGQSPGTGGGADMNNMANMLNMLNMMNAGNRSSNSSNSGGGAPSFDAIRNMLPPDMMEALTYLMKNKRG